MKKLFVPLILILLLACNNNSNENQHEIPGSATIQEETHEANSAAVLLDNGKKWQANIETTEGIAKMRNLAQNALANGENPSEVLPGLQAEFKTIFEKCTMKGEAHDQLHNYLVPVKDHLDKIRERNEAEENLKGLVAYLGTYENYFE